MKQNFWLPPVLACLCLLLTSPAHLSVCAQVVNEANASALSNAPYRAGERLSYNVSFSRFQTAAHVEMFVAGRTNVSAREVVELRGRVETLGVVNVALYSINNDYISYVDPANGLPIRTQQIIREGASHPIDAARDFNQPVGASALQVRETAGGFPGTYDFLSAIYRLRSLPLAQGAAYRLSVQGASELYDAELRVVGRETLKTNIGSFNSIATQVFVRKNPAANDYKVRIYFSDDERHVPVLITAQHPSGEIRAEIASAEFLPETSPPAVAVTPPPVNQLNVPPPVVLPGTPRPPNPNPTRQPPAPGNSSEGAGDGNLPGLPFSVGEQLNFRFFLGDTAQPAGAAALQVRARAKYFNRDGLLLQALMNTSGALQKLFPVNDQINSYVDTTSLFPFRTELRILEGKHRLNAVVNVDQDRGNAQFDDRTRLDIPVGTHDLISVFYALRSFDLSPPKRNAVSLLINKRPRTLFITALRRETIEVGGQRINATQLSLVTDDTQGDRLQIRAWVSTDRRRLPLRITAVTPLGPVRADLAILPVGLQ